MQPSVVLLVDVQEEDRDGGLGRGKDDAGVRWGHLAGHVKQINCSFEHEKIRGQLSRGNRPSSRKYDGIARRVHKLHTP